MYVIGLTGGIAAGKSFVARCFADLGVPVIDSDALAADAYRDSAIVAAVVARFGPAAAGGAAGGVNRKHLAAVVFADPAARADLNAIVHPWTDARRRRLMADFAAAGHRVVVWDSPLLIEAGLAAQCQTVIFIDSPLPLRQARAAARGWPPGELERREKSQCPLDKKRAMSHDVLVNSTDEDSVRRQVRDILSRIPR